MTASNAQATEPGQVTTYSIRVASRLSGISADTLRMWERRYDFPKPVRNPNGNRVYSSDDVDRLVLIARAMQAGYRPGEVVGRQRAELEALLAQNAAAPAVLAQDDGNVAAVLDAIARDDLRSVRRTLGALAASHGARAFVTDVVGPLLDHTGHAWASGRIEVRHEHMLSELLANQIRALLAAYDDHAGRPVVLLATLPQELHRLGLDMTALFLSTLGADVRLLGPNTPADQIVSAAKAQKVDAVALSVSVHADALAAKGYLSWIASELPDPIELWVGGRGARNLSIEAPRLLTPSSWQALEDATRRLRSRA